MYYVTKYDNLSVIQVGCGLRDTLHPLGYERVHLKWQINPFISKGRLILASVTRGVFSRHFFMGTALQSPPLLLILPSAVSGGPGEVQDWTNINNLISGPAEQRPTQRKPCCQHL